MGDVEVQLRCELCHKFIDLDDPRYHYTCKSYITTLKGSYYFRDHIYICLECAEKYTEDELREIVTQMFDFVKDLYHDQAMLGII